MSDLTEFIDVPIADLHKAFAHIPSEERKILLAGIAKLKASRSPLDFMEVSSGGTLSRAPHLEILNQTLVQSTKEPLFVIMSLPVRMGKSFLSSNYFPAWYMSQFPHEKMMIASYNKDTSTSFTSKARDIYVENQDLFDHKIDRTRNAKALWGVEGFPDGLVRASGVGSSIIGHGGKIIICDDMYKDSEQAFSKNYNDKIREWWTQSMRHRLEPGGSIILVLARWATDDLAGWLIDSAKENTDKTTFVEIKVPALSTGACEFTGRKHAGIPIWPERYDVNGLKALRADVGDMIWACQFQQEPVSLKDSMFDPNKWKYYPKYIPTEDTNKYGKYIQVSGLKWLHEIRPVPSGVKLVRYWDLSGGGKESDYLVGLLMAKDKDNFCYIVDLVREKFTEADAQMQIESTLISTCAADRERFGNKVDIVLEDVGGLGKSAVANYKNVVLKDFNVKTIKKTGSKVNEARALSAYQAKGNVYIVMEKEVVGFTAPEWTEAFISEMSSCTIGGTTGKNDDQIDGASGAFNHLFVDGIGRAGKTYSGKRLGGEINAASLGPIAGRQTRHGKRATLAQARQGSKNRVSRMQALKQARR